MNKEIKRICDKKPEDVTMVEYNNLKWSMLNRLGRISGACDGVRCMDCCLSNEGSCRKLEIIHPQEAIELVQEWHKEHTLKIDWSKVPVDAKIIVWEDGRESHKVKRHFARFEDGKIYAWVMGATSWSVDSDVDVSRWEYAELAEVKNYET